MLITRTSMLTGTSRTRDIDVTPYQLHTWKHGGLIQHAMPGVSVDDREYIMTGIIPEEWDAAFPEEETCEEDEPAF